MIQAEKSHLYIAAHVTGTSASPPPRFNDLTPDSCYGGGLDVSVQR